MEEWFVQLTRARNLLGVSQVDLAARSHVSLSSIKAYELGRRHPSRPYLTAILDALKIERGARNRILGAAGFVPDGLSIVPEELSIVPGEPAGTFTREEAAALIEELKWPAFVLDEYVGVVAANGMAQRLWGVDLREEFTDSLDRNLLSVASDPRFADRLVNWDEAIGKIVSVFKRKEWGPRERLDDPSPAFAVVLERFLAGDPKYVSRLVDIWQKTPSAIWDQKMRWSYPVVWKDPEAGVIRFECVVTVASHADSTNFNDWIPVGPESWAALDRVLA
ncbi:MAG: helix-turn-helix domain-containing protein [Chloroflexi bacterium]|nr:helix-turn-helix domain-containing protein [Chloroflexota bacterium]